MIWSPESQVGVIALANGRYAGAVYGTAADAAVALVAGLGGRGSQPRLQPHPTMAAIRATIDEALIAGDFAVIEPLLSANVDQDEALERRAKVVAGLSSIHGVLRSEVAGEEGENVRVKSPTTIRWWLSGANGSRVGVRVMLNPMVPPQVQTLEITSVLCPTSGLKAAAEAAMSDIEAGTHQLSSLLAPGEREPLIHCSVDSHKNPNHSLFSCDICA